ncbi:ferric reductase like transmembrane component [Nitzschia inconspicua]|uniref:Ferric reductase like transmembrane component n=1 Tax=Nitzschia inconspicua TaxID=303405 RepID=A0A9K3PWF8_9STRA|nr:ferric reductase like transmembrane component [Nitzschia inconspicua]
MGVDSEANQEHRFPLPPLTRLFPFWFTVAAALWSISIVYAWNSDKAWEAIQKDIIDPLFKSIKDPVAVDWSFILGCFTVPILFAACLGYLILTNAPLPANQISWVNRIVAFIVRFRPASAEEGYHIAKKNQFLIGEPNFNVLALFIVGLPFISQCIYFKNSLEYTENEAVEYGWDQERLQRERTLSVSYLSGWIGIFALMWFLIPVARHSVLLVALGWSPVHALRIHIWAGHLSFTFVGIHALTMLIVWFQDPIPVYQQFIPPANCWAWNANNTSSELEEEGEIHYGCSWQWFNLTGLIAMIIFIILWVSSLHWFRRRNYRLFYLMHVIFGTLMLLSSLLHYAFMVMYWLPSITYYLASTSPTLIQALASRYRGGVKITKVVAIEDSSGCVEVHVDTANDAAYALNRMPSQFVKLCVPKISVVWHPFTVFSHAHDAKTLRFLVRPVGPFTRELTNQLTGSIRPVTILDGFYCGANRCQQALLHDHITIVSGGVAITPFLSMIPALIREISSKPTKSATLRSISLHWACRENGLLLYITNNYLSNFQEQAAAAGVKLDITVYNTNAAGTTTDDEGRRMIMAQKTSNTLDETMQDSCLNSDDSKKSSEESKNSSVEGVTFVLDEVSSVTEKYGESPCTNIPTDLSNNQNTDAGFGMELGRMMPARFSTIYWNIPTFVAFSLPIWLGFVLIHETYILDEPVNFKELSTTAFYTVILVFGFAAFGVIVEVVVLKMRSHWPSERFDDFELEVAAPIDTTWLKEEDETNDSLVTFKVLFGRPTTEQIMKEARHAESPGIFLCGPEKMIKMVKGETRKENSWLGRTRFCVYDEPFEF